MQEKGGKEIMKKKPGDKYDPAEKYIDVVLYKYNQKIANISQDALSKNDKKISKDKADQNKEVTLEQNDTVKDYIENDENQNKKTDINTNESKKNKSDIVNPFNVLEKLCSIYINKNT